MKLSYTLVGGLGDFILKYLGSPGDRLSHILHAFPGQVHFRVASSQPAGHDLIKNNPFFTEAEIFEEIPNERNILPNDIQVLQSLNEYQKLIPPIWLSSEEQEILANIKKPYSVFHPWASMEARSLVPVYDIHKLAQWIADTSGINLVVLGTEEFGYKSHNVTQLKCSSRLSVQTVQGATFMVGTHSSMSCAAWVYRIPSFCIGPSYLLFHNWYAPFSYDYYLKPMFRDNNLFLMFEQSEQFFPFFDHFLRNATSLTPRLAPEEYRLRKSLSCKAS